MPALMLLGFEMDLYRVMTVSVLGGLLGILMMIPLRRAFIVHQHGSLTYPEGAARAEVLGAGHERGGPARTRPPAAPGPRPPAWAKPRGAAAPGRGRYALGAALHHRRRRREDGAA